MKLRFGAKLITLLFVVTFTSSMIGYILGARASRVKDTPPSAPSADSLPVSETGIYKDETDIQSDVTSKGNTVTQSYILREDGGTLSLYTKYSDEKEKLYQRYNISVSLLPKSDRELLKNGIETDALSDALQLVEDYSS